MPAKPVRTVRPAPARRLHLQVVAGGERALAGAGDDADPQIVARGELVPHGGEFVVRVGVQRVQHLRPVERDDAEPAFVLDGAVLVGHQPITASLRQSRRSCRSSIPSQSASTSALCWPSSGAGLDRRRRAARNAPASRSCVVADLRMLHGLADAALARRSGRWRVPSCPSPRRTEWSRCRPGRIASCLSCWLVQLATMASTSSRCSVRASGVS